jgi:SAM-dependent methyltransferase
MEKYEWFKDWFASDYYQIVYKHRDNKDAQKLLELVINKLKIEKSCYILDAACGAGRHLSYLKEKGFYNLYGFDLSFPLLKLALQKGLVNSIVNADIRTVPFKIKFDLILNIFTSFGYFEDDCNNFLFFKNYKNSLKQKGIIVFDYFNSNYVCNNLVLESDTKIDDITINEKRTIENNRVIKKINIGNNLNNLVFFESVKLYKPEFLSQKFEEIGLKIIGEFGNYNGDSFDKSCSERIILFLENE